MSEVGIRAWGLVRYAFLQTKMFRWTRAGALHYVLFLGSTLLLIGNINMVTGGLLQAVVGWPLGGALWTLAVAIQNVIARRRAAGARLLLQATAGRSAEPPDARIAPGCRS